MIEPATWSIAARRSGTGRFVSRGLGCCRAVRDPALALYAFCRLADDEVDLRGDKAAAVLRLRDRLGPDLCRPAPERPEDRAFAAMVEEFDMPRALPEALLEGLAWDADGAALSTLSELFDYSARVASAVGAMMCVLMRVRDADALARACDLGVAMQLTNIARDVGEDARGAALPAADWMAEAGLAPDAFFAEPLPSEEVRAMVRRLLREAERFYNRSEAGVAALPLSCRPGIYAARHIYAGIGEGWGDGRAGALISVFAQLEAQDREARLG
jgi:phytoene synthase